MDAQQFLAEFGHIANAPGGVARLRELILALSVQGRIVPQDDTEEPAVHQLERIRQIALAQPVTRRRRKSTNASLLRSRSDERFPSGWERARICDLVRVLNGRAYSKQELLDAGTPVLRVGNLFTSDRWYYSNLNLDDEKYCDEGDLLYAWSASFGPFIWKGKRVIYHYHIWKLDLFSADDIDKQFLYTWLLEKTQEIKAAGHGISMAHMTKEKFEQLEIALPPLREQARIVGRVEELMALCDRLEQQQHDRQKLQKALRQSTLRVVADAQTPVELEAAWSRLEANFSHLFERIDHFKELRDLLLDLAASSRLATSGSTSNDNDLKSLLEAAKIQQRKEFSYREQRELLSLPKPTIRHGIAQVSIGHITKVISGQHLSPNQYNTRREGIPYVTGPAEFLDGKPNPNKWTQERRAIARSGDILITVKGSGVGKIAICEIEELAISRQLMAIRPMGGLLHEYLEICIRSSEKRFQNQKLGIAIPGIGRKEVLGLSIALPSFEEQGRIVNILKKLLTTEELLEAKTNETEILGERFATSAISALVGFSISKEEDVLVKAPQTELIAPLRLGSVPDVKAKAPLATILARHDGELAARDLWQRFGGEIDAFYAQLKTEVEHGWIAEPAVAEVRERPTEATGA